MGKKLKKLSKINNNLFVIVQNQIRIYLISQKNYLLNDKYRRIRKKILFIE